MAAVAEVLEDRTLLSGDPWGGGWNEPPVAYDDYFSTIHDSMLVENVLWNDEDYDGPCELTAILETSVSHGTLSLFSDGTFEYWPNPGFVGQDTFTYRASDGQDASEVATVYLDVFNNAPTAEDDRSEGPYLAVYNTRLDVSADEGVLINDWDMDGDGPLTAVLAQLPQHGSVTLNSDGSFTYWPAPDFLGSDWFTYRADDGLPDGLSEEATVWIDVVRPQMDIDVDSNNDGWIDWENDPSWGTDDPIEEQDPGQVFGYNGDDDNGNGVLDVQDGPLTNGNGDPVADDDLVEAYVGLDFGSMADWPSLEGFEVVLSAGSSVEIYDTRWKQQNITGVPFVLDAWGNGFPSVVYLEGVNPGLTLLTATLLNPQGATIHTDTAKVTVVKVDIDIDGDNTGAIDGTDGEEISEAGSPGQILAVGVDQRKEVRLKVDIPDQANPEQFTYTLTYDDSVIELYDTGPSQPGQPPSGNKIPSGTPLTEIGGITVENLRAGLTVYVDGVNLGATDIVFEASKGNLIFSDKVHVTVALDLDTDSDNEGRVETTNTEEDRLEDWYAIDNSALGKRIFENRDDDNKNGKPDFSDNQSAFIGLQFENDLAQIQLQFTQTDMPGYKLVLEASSNLALYVTDGELPTPQELTGPSGQTWKAYTWDLGPNSAWPGSLTVYAEGSEPGAGRLHWRFQKDATILARDAVRINVENLVWPFETQTHADWNARPTSDWVGLELADAWYIDKALVDYIVNPADKGSIATIYPDMENGTRASQDGPDSVSTNTYGTNVTLVFDYTFERRGGNEFGYVQANVLPKVKDDDKRVDPGSGEATDRAKLSFVSNSGIKIPHADKYKEVAILDVEKMIELAGGIDSFTKDENAPRGPKGIDDNGMVDIMQTVFGHVYDFEDEPLSRLMSGVLYDGDYTKMTDFQAGSVAEATSQDFIDTLARNAAHQGASNRMEIIFSGTRLTVKINGQVVYDDPNAGLTLGQFLVQSHWGSGVVFSRMDVLPNGG
ncbi:MAG: tandem-95 repeat protein [Planctomycetes bacterium]|nr:tandem-95 repeat protein [Planctomycetota bacterium]